MTINIDRDKAAVLGVSMQNAQTLQPTMSEQRVGYFILNGKQYQILSQIDRENRNKPSDLQNIYVRNNNGELIALDNLVTTSRVLCLRNCIATTVLWPLRFRLDWLNEKRYQRIG